MEVKYHVKEGKWRMKKEDLITILNRSSPAEVLEMLQRKGKQKKYCPFILHSEAAEKKEKE